MQAIMQGIDWLACGRRITHRSEKMALPHSGVARLVAMLYCFCSSLCTTEDSPAIMHFCLGRGLEAQGPPMTAMTGKVMPCSAAQVCRQGCYRVSHEHKPGERT
jgi:hypothetical protein